MSAFPDEQPIPNVFKECRTIYEILNSQKINFYLNKVMEYQKTIFYILFEDSSLISYIFLVMVQNALH